MVKNIIIFLNSSDRPKTVEDQNGKSSRILLVLRFKPYSYTRIQDVFYIEEIIL